MPQPAPTLPRRPAPPGRRWIWAGALVVATLVTASGCKTGPAYREIHPLRDNRHPGQRHMQDFDRDLLYLPNRLVDLTEWVRFGGTLGPGAGFEIRITRWIQLGAIGYWDAGLAWEGRRRAAYRWGGHWRLAAGPWSTESDNKNRWCRPDWEFSIEAHAFGGLRVAIDFAEFVDLFLGFFGIDILHDDFDYRN